jgi:hypothetical protein
LADPMSASDLCIEDHYTILVYPFRHDLHGAERALRLNRLGPNWRTWWSRFEPDAIASAKDNTLFFLPYVRELLFPELTMDLPVGEATGSFSQAERLRQRTPGAMADLPSDAVLRFTFDAARLKDFSPLLVELERTDSEGRPTKVFSEAIELCWVDLALFPQHVGFVAVKVRLKDKTPTVAKLREFHYLIRLVHPPRVGWTLARWNCATEGGSVSFTGRDFVDYLVQGLVGPLDNLEGSFPEYFKRLAGASYRYSESPNGQTYGQTFKLFAFGLLRPCEHPQTETDPYTAATSATSEPLFDTPAKLALYELATCTDSAHPDYVPNRDYLNQLWKRSGFAPWDNWQSIALQDTAVFLAVRASNFTRGALGANVEHDYFTLYILAAFQKMRLSLMFGEQMMRDVHLHRNLRKARQLWTAFLSFQDHFWFSEATRSRQGTELYRHFQEALDVIALHRQLSAQVRELQDHYEGKYERRMARLINLITFIGMPTGLVVSLFSQVFVPKSMHMHHAILATVLVYGAFFVLWGLWAYYRPE